MSPLTLRPMVYVALLFGSLLAVPSAAHAAALNMTASDIWADGGGADVGPAAAGDTVDISGAGAILAILNNGFNDDGGGFDTFTLGAVTDSGGSGVISIFSNDSGAHNGTLSVTIASADIGASFGVTHSDNALNSASVNVTGALSVGTTLDVTNGELTNNSNVTMSVGGNLAVTGITTLTARAGAGGGAASSLILSGSTNSSASYVLDDDTGLASLIFGRGSSQTVSGAINGDGAGEGTVQILSAGTDVTFADNIGATSLLSFVVGPSTVARFGAGTLNATTITNNATLVFNTAVTAAGTTLELGSNAASAITMGTGTYAGNVVLDASGFTTVNATNVVAVNPHPNFSSGTLTLIDGPAGNGTYDSAAKYSVTGSNLLTTYSVSIDGNSDVLLTAQRVPVSSVAGSLNTTMSAADALGAGFDASQGDAQANAAYQTVLASGGSAAKEAAEQSQPEVNGATIGGIQSVGQQTFNTVGSHLASTRAGGVYTGQAGAASGVSTGNGYLDSGIWARGFVFYGNQDAVDGVAGYDSNTWGIALGWETKLTDTIRGGIGYSYGQTDVDGDGSGRNRSDIDSHQVFIYGDLTMESWYVEAMAGYGYNDIDASRSIAFGGLNRTASAGYDADQWMTRIEFGVPLAIGDPFVLTPSLGYDFFHVDTESYTETGAGSLNLEVNPDDVESHILRGGLKLHWNVADDSGTWTPQVRGSYGYDLAGDDARTAARYSGGGAVFETIGPDTDDWEASAGGGLAWTSPNGQWRVGADYDAIFMEEYLGHSGRVEVLYRY